MDKMEQHAREVVDVTWNFSGRLDETKYGAEQNALVGLAAEAGELLDIGKKKWFHDEKPDAYFREKFLSELGDVAYYFLASLDELGFTLDEVLAYNRKKLASRHPELGEVSERFGATAIKG